MRIEETVHHESAIRNPQSAMRGFTLAEVLVASTISGFVAVVAVGALNALAGSAQTVNRTTETTSEIRFAARMMARDLANFYRDPNPQNMKLLGSSEGEAAGGMPFLTFYITGRAKARANQPEGDVYEVEYFLATREQGPEQETQRTGESSEENTVLFRRVWPNPDKDRTPGGILTPIAENIGVFQVRFWDGKQWMDQWTEEMQSLPECFEVTLATMPPAKGDPVVETFTMTFPRLSKRRRRPAGRSVRGRTQGQQGSGTSSTAESTSGPADQQGIGPGTAAGSKPAPEAWNRRMMHSTRDNQGMILIAVLWMIAVMTALAAIVGQTSRLNLKMAASATDEVRCKWACRAGTENAIAVLAEDLKDSDCLLDLWSDNDEDFNDVELERCRYTVRVTDEAGKLNINTVTKEQLMALPYMEENIADAILDWRDGDDEPQTQGGGSRVL